MSILSLFKQWPLMSTVLLPALLTPSLAQANPWYRVEVMLVAYQNEATIDHELWPDAINSEPPALSSEATTDQPQHNYNWWLQPQVANSNHPNKTEDARSLWAKFGFKSIPDSQWPQPLTPLNNLILAKKAKKINYRKDMEVIWHQAWIEPIQNQDQAIKHLIDVELHDQLNIQLRGTIQLHLSRYLHITTNLDIQHYQLPETNALTELSLQTLPASTTSQHDYREDLLTDTEVSLSEPQITPIRSARIQQSRRMRSGELHYIDHPMLGLVVTVIPIETQADIEP